MKKLRLSQCISSQANDLHFRGDNISSVVDRLVRLAAKITESYASDIVYHANYLLDVAKNGKAESFLLTFRESGIERYDISDVVDDACHPMSAFKILEMPKSFTGYDYPPTYIQCWMVETFLNEYGERTTILRRVEINFA